MSNILKFFILTVAVVAPCFAKIEKFNSLWFDVNQVVEDIQTLQSHLVQPIEDLVFSEKISFSIIVTTVLKFLQNNPPPALALESSIMKNDLDQPVDVYAAETVRTLAREQLLLGWPIYAVKKSCRPFTEKRTCQDKYAEEIDALRKKCFGIDQHVDLLTAAIDLHKDEGYRNLLDYVLLKSKTADKEESLQVALEILTEEKYNDIRKKLQKYYQLFAQFNYFCVDAVFN